MAETLAAPVTFARERRGMPMQWCAGFFFATRMLVTYVGFQSDPQVGSGVAWGLAMCVLLCAALSHAGQRRSILHRVRKDATLRWLAFYLVFTGASIFWSETESRTVAAVYWTGMAADAGIAVLLIEGLRPRKRLEALMRGFIAGALVVAGVAWCIPRMADLRLGNEDFLHPNALGLEFALAFFLAQHLTVRERRWRWAMMALGISLLRTISKTSILAWLIVESLYLIKGSQLSRKVKIRIAIGSALTLGAFWGLLEAYFQNYADTNQLETLTGRAAIWTITLVMGLEEPWLGHGVYSFRGLIPALGDFQPWHAHNELLQQFFESGVAGVVLALGMYISLAREALRSKDSEYGTLAAALVLFCAVHGLTDAVNFGLSMPFWLMAGLAGALTRESSSEEAAA